MALAAENNSINKIVKADRPKRRKGVGGWGEVLVTIITHNVPNNISGTTD